MPHLPDCAASWKAADKPCYVRPEFVVTTEDGAQQLVCEAHAGWLLSEALTGRGEVVVTEYEGN